MQPLRLFVQTLLPCPLCSLPLSPAAVFALFTLRASPHLPRFGHGGPCRQPTRPRRPPDLQCRTPCRLWVACGPCRTLLTLTPHRRLWVLIPAPVHHLAGPRLAAPQSSSGSQWSGYGNFAPVPVPSVLVRPGASDGQLLGGLSLSPDVRHRLLSILHTMEQRQVGQARVVLAAPPGPPPDPLPQPQPCAGPGPQTPRVSGCPGLLYHCLSGSRL